MRCGLIECARNQGGLCLIAGQVSLNEHGTCWYAANAIEVEPVVRCRDCKHSMLWRKPTNKVIGECFLRKWNSDDEQFCLIGADDFCSWGERRADDGN